MSRVALDNCVGKFSLFSEFLQVSSVKVKTAKTAQNIISENDLIS